MNLNIKHIVLISCMMIISISNSFAEFSAYKSTCSEFVTYPENNIEIDLCKCDTEKFQNDFQLVTADINVLEIRRGEIFNESVHQSEIGAYIVEGKAMNTINNIQALEQVEQLSREKWKEPNNPMLVLINQTKKAEDEAIISELHKQNEVIKIYPNPFTTGFTIGYELSKDALVGIAISNLSGTISQEVFSANQTKGFHTFAIPNFPFPAGNYYAWLSVDGKLDSRTIIKN